MMDEEEEEEEKVRKWRRILGHEDNTQPRDLKFRFALKACPFYFDSWKGWSQRQLATIFIAAARVAHKLPSCHGDHTEGTRCLDRVRDRGTVLICIMGETRICQDRKPPRLPFQSDFKKRRARLFGYHGMGWMLTISQKILLLGGLVH